jgi:hypothetical protein
MDDEPHYVLPDSKWLSAFPDAVYKTYTTDTGERITVATLDIGEGLVLNYSADETFAKARENPGLMVKLFPWYSIIPWLDNDPADVQRFVSVYDSQPAETARRRALRGVKSTNYEDEATVLRHVAEIVGATAPHLTIPGPIQPLLTERFDRNSVKLSVDRIAEWVVNAVLHDHEAPKRLHHLLKNPDAAADPKGDQLSSSGKIFTAFIHLVVENEALPTKKDVRTRAGLGDEQKDISAASRVYRELGLQGLPEG